MMFLPDINVWLALSFDRHVHHPIAKEWFETALEESCSFCRLTQLGFLRLETNPKVFGEDAFSPTEAWQLYDRLSDDPRVTFSVEPEKLEVCWRDVTQLRTLSPNIWSDAYLAAFAQSAAMEMVTFDKGFAAFKGLQCKILS